MSELLIAAPLSIERLAVRAARRPVEVVRTGMGPRRSQQALPRLTAAPARALAVVGFCGALDDTLGHGELVVAGELRDPEGLVTPCAGAETLVAELARAGLKARVGTIASARRLVVGDARGRLAAAGAIAVDMESAWLAPAAAGRPFAVVRVVVDTPDREVHRPLATVNGIFRASAVLRRVVRPLEIWAGSASGAGTASGIATVEAS
jgi:4-hydroxy-3-methylbut-2-enyl diphosphate reductase